MLTPKKGYIDYSKVYSDVTERQLLAWNQNNILHVIYFISSFQNQY